MEQDDVEILFNSSHYIFRDKLPISKITLMSRESFIPRQTLIYFSRAMESVSMQFIARKIFQKKRKRKLFFSQSLSLASDSIVRQISRHSQIIFAIDCD